MLFMTRVLPGHLSLWQPEDRLLIVGDALSDYDVGWVNMALDGGAVWYAARRIFAFALMIHDGIPVEVVEPYLHARVWLVDAARHLSRTPEALAAELIDTMLRSSAIVCRDERLHAAAEHTSVSPDALRVSFPRAWPMDGNAAQQVSITPFTKGLPSRVVLP